MPLPLTTCTSWLPTPLRWEIHQDEVTSRLFFFNRSLAIALLRECEEVLVRLFDTAPPLLVLLVVVT